MTGPRGVAWWRARKGCFPFLAPVWGALEGWRLGTVAGACHRFARGHADRVVVGGDRWAS
ncbi:MAG: hypothetical protein AB1816_19795 [Bacillota bacterium]